MLRNYIKIAFRHLYKNKAHSMINIFGLALGIGACLIILLFVLDDLSYDDYHEKSNRIYRVHQDFKFGQKEGSFPLSPALMGESMQEDYPEVESFFRFREYGTAMFEQEGRFFKEADIIFADSTFFKFFSIPLAKGDPKRALEKPNSAVISETLARKYFGDKEPLGNILTMDDDQLFTITGVMEDIPYNTHFHYEVLLSLATREESRKDAWMSNNFHTYLLLKEGADPQALEAKLPAFVKNYMGPEIEEFLGKTLEEVEAEGTYFILHLMPLEDIHLRSQTELELAKNGDIQYVYIFSAVALFILLIACVNFMNLATAKSEHRAREVGVRKVLGAERKHLIPQFLTEASVIAYIALVFALLIVELVMPFFNHFTGKDLKLFAFKQFRLIPVMLLFPLVIGLFAGSYPAFFLSSFQPVDIIRGKMKRGLKSRYLRNGLVIFQFSISLVMIVGTLIIYQQLQHVQNTRLGYDKERLLIVHDTYTLGEKINVFRDEVLQHPVFINGTLSSFMPAGYSGFNNTSFFPDGNPAHSRATPTQYWKIDYHFIPTMGMEMAEGRNFSKEFGTDSLGIILNESAARSFGFDEPIGRTLSTFDFRNGKSGFINYTVIGVVKDFHYTSMRQAIDPLVMVLSPDNANMIAFRTEPGTTEEAINILETTWSQMGEGRPFEYTFMDERLEETYTAEIRLGQIFGVFGFLAIFIACLGLFGLASFTAEKRSKEIGVRKILGASPGQILVMLSKDFGKLLVIAIFIGAPIGWYIMNEWLNDFAYRISIHWYIFLVAGTILLLIAFLTVSYQSLKAAKTDPVLALRSE